MDLRALMFQNVYENPAAHKEEEKVVKMLTELYEYYVEHPEAMQVIERISREPVSYTHLGNHLSRPYVAIRLKRPT